MIAVIFLNTVFELRQYEIFRKLIVGLSMELIMVWRPRGLIATRAPSLVLQERKAISGALVKEGHG